MKKFVVVVLLIVLMPSTTWGQSSKTVVENYENGKTKIKYRKDKNGKIHGSYQEYYETGKKKLLKTYKNGVLHGKYTEYDDKGKPSIVASHDKGQLHGKYVVYKKGKPETEKFYVNGELIIPKSVKDIKNKFKLISKMEHPKSDEKGFKLTSGHIDAWRSLLQYRYLCGVDYEHVVMTQSYNSYSRAAASICNRIGRLDHRPKNPGMKEEDYKYAYHGTTHTNLSWNSGIAKQIEGFMFDSDKSNISTVGHRRWCLCPMMKEVGFAKVGAYGAMYAHDKQHTDYSDFEFVAFPTKGYMPADMFSKKHAWNVTLNPKKYKTPQKSEVTVNLYKVNLKVSSAKSGKSFRSQLTLNKPLKLNYFTVCPGNYGNIRGSIIFRPEKNEVSSGNKYWVEIKGLKYSEGGDAEFGYYVEFF